MRAEFLDLSEGLPGDFENNWIMVGPIPKGKRCLALTFNEQKRATFGGTLAILFLFFFVTSKLSSEKKRAVNH
jgi:hypothetical protein